jgi:hypothetical protein
LDYQTRALPQGRGQGLTRLKDTVKKRFYG